MLAGGRVTGRLGGYSVGVMNIETDTMDYAAGAHTVNLPRANYSVVRVKRNVFGYSSLGAIFLNSEGGVGLDYNRTLGARPQPRARARRRR